MQRLHDPDVVVCLGDLIDASTPSVHAHNPDMPSAGDELIQTKKAIKKLYKIFPEMTITMGNHDNRYLRHAFTAGIPSDVIKTYNDILGVGSGWQFVEETYIDNCRYLHGTGCSKAHLNAFSSGVSHIQGHLHSQFSVEYRATKYNRVFGATVGCLVDNKALAFIYGKPFRWKPILGCGIITDGRTCELIPMEL